MLYIKHDRITINCILKMCFFLSTKEILFSERGMGKNFNKNEYKHKRQVWNRHFEIIQLVPAAIQLS